MRSKFFPKGSSLFAVFESKDSRISQKETRGRVLPLCRVFGVDIVAVLDKRPNKLSSVEVEDITVVLEEDTSV